MKNKDEESSESKVSAEEIWERVAHLAGEGIGVERACEKYDLSVSSMYAWIEKGYVRVLKNRRGGGRGIKRLLNEADVAYIAEVADIRGRRQGREIITSDFIPPHVQSLGDS